MQFADVRKYVKGVLMNSFTNKLVLDRLSDSGGTLQYDGKSISSTTRGLSTAVKYYSNDEMVIGRHTNGKPVYKKCIPNVYFDNSGYLATIVSTLTALNVDELLLASAYVGNKATFIDLSKTLGLITPNARGTGTLVIEYTKTTDDENSFDPSMIKNINLTNAVSSQYLYSEEEQIVGCSEDGKPIYSKSIIQDGLDEVNLSGLNIDEFRGIEGGFAKPSGGFIGVNACMGSNYATCAYLEETKKLTFISGGSWTVYSCPRLTIYYTKTTDEPNSFDASMLMKGKLKKLAEVNYPTEEQVIGTWIDGRPIYEVAIPFPSNGTLTGNAITIEGLASHNPAFLIDHKVIYQQNMRYIGRTEMYLNTDGNMVMNTLNGGSAPYSTNDYIIVQFVKTTD